MSRAIRTLTLTMGLVAATAVPVLARPFATRSVREHIDLTLVSKSGGSKFVHRGRASGTFNGTVRSRITLAHSVVLTGTVTISTKDGNVRMDVAGRARSLSLRTKFSGTATIVEGTGRYAHVRGAGRFTGVVNRSTWHATIDATGSFTTS